MDFEGIKNYSEFIAEYPSAEVAIPQNPLFTGRIFLDKKGRAWTFSRKDGHLTVVINSKAKFLFVCNCVKEAIKGDKRFERFKK